MSTRDYEKELAVLKEEIRDIIGEEELKELIDIVNTSFQYDVKPTFKTSQEVR